MMKFAAIFILLAFAGLSAAPKEITVYVTSNLAGRFPLDQSHDENHLLRIGAYLRAAREKNPQAYFLDAGNAFYPGRLSRFSFGSLTADYRSRWSASRLACVLRGNHRPA